LEDHVKEVNAKGGTKGRKIRLIIYSDKDTPADAQASATHLMEKDHVAGIVGPEWSLAAMRLGPVSESNKVPVIASAASYPWVTVDFTGSPRPYMFRACFTDPAQVAALTDYAFHELGMRRAAILFNYESINGMDDVRGFETEFNRLGGKVVARESYRLGATSDFRPQLARIAAAKPDCLLFPPTHYLQDITRLASQAKALGFKCQFLGFDNWAVHSLLTLAGKDIDGAVFTTGLSIEDPQFADFNARFLKAHGTQCEASTYYALDAIMALEHAAKLSLEKTGKISPVAMKGALENMKDVPVFTGKMTMDPKTHTPRNKPVLVVAIKDGKWKTVKTYQPE